MKYEIITAPEEDIELIEQLAPFVGAIMEIGGTVTRSHEEDGHTVIDEIAIHEASVVVPPKAEG